MSTSFYTEEELTDIGFKEVGENVLISRKASIYGASNMTIGSNVRIDDFCLLSGNIEIGNYVHISAFNALYGASGIKIGNFSGISPRCSIYSAVDDFSGETMISPLVPSELTNLQVGEVIINDYVQIGANSIIYPDIAIPEGVATGAFTLVNKNNLENWTIYIGIPAKKLKDRSKKLLQIEKEFINND